MTAITYRIITILAAAAILPPRGAVAQAPDEVEVSPSVLDVTTGARNEVLATPYSQAGEVVLSADVRWTSSDTTVAQVAPDPSTEGVAAITALRAGLAVIEARAGGARGRVRVMVTDPADQPETARRVAALEPVTACASALSLPDAGSWVEWQTPRARVRLSYLGTRSDAADAPHQFEITGQGAPGGGGVTMQVVTTTWPNTTEGLQEVVAQSRGRPAIRFSREQLLQNRRRIPSNPVKVAASRCADLAEIGEEAVSVPAGRFTARHLRDPEGTYDLWVSAAVPFGLVKMVSASGTVELQQHGTGASSAITDSPRQPQRRSGRRRPRP